MHPIKFSICSLLLQVLLPSQIPQEAAWEKLPLRGPEILDPEERGIAASVSGGKVVELIIGPGNRVPLTRPVSDWRIGELPGSVYVILAGGIRESLDLYLYESKSGAVHVIDSDGGRLLADEFGAGNGSWPRFEGRALVFFPFERDGKLRVTVVNFQGQVLATQALPLDVDAYTVQFNPRSQQLRVSFAGQAEDLSFLHPAAGRLELDSGLLLFAGPERRSILLRNEGRRPLDLLLQIEGEGFRIIGPESLTLPAASSRDVTVEMLEAADSQARLSILSPVEGASAVVGLQNMPALAELAEGLARDPGAATPQQSGVLPENSAPLSPEIKPPLAEAEPRISDAGKARTPSRFVLDPKMIDLRRLNGGAVEISGRLIVSGQADELPSVLVRNRVTGMVESSNPEADGSFSLRLTAGDGEVIDCALVVSGEDPEFQALGPAFPILSRMANELQMRGSPGSDLMLLEVSTRAGADMPNRVLRSWRLQVDLMGRARVPLTALGSAEGPRSFLLLSNNPHGSLSQTPVLRVAATRGK